MGKMHKNVFLGAHCKENFRLLSEIFPRVNYHFCYIFHGFYSVILKSNHKTLKLKNS